MAITPSGTQISSVVPILTTKKPTVTTAVMSAETLSNAEMMRWVEPRVLGEGATGGTLVPPFVTGVEGMGVGMGSDTAGAAVGLGEPS